MQKFDTTVPGILGNFFSILISQKKVSNLIGRTKETFDVNLEKPPKN